MENETPHKILSYFILSNYKVSFWSIVYGTELRIEKNNESK